MIRGFQEMDFPESPHLSPHIPGLLTVYTGYVRKIIKDNLLAYQRIIWLYVSFQWWDFLEYFCLGTNERLEGPK